MVRLSQPIFGTLDPYISGRPFSVSFGVDPSKLLDMGHIKDKYSLGSLRGSGGPNSLLSELLDFTALAFHLYFGLTLSLSPICVL